MVENKKLEYCLNKTCLTFLAITAIVCIIAGTTIYLKLIDIQKNISTLRNDLIVQVEDNKKNVASINKLKYERDEALSILNQKLEKHELEIDKIKKTNGNTLQIQRHLPSNDIVIKRYNNTQEKAFSGVGLKFRKGAGNFVILEVLDGLPAHKSGLHEGDEIVKINGEPTSQMDQQEFVEKLRGPKGSTVKLSYKPSGSLDTVKDVTVTRDTIDINKIDERE